MVTRLIISSALFFVATAYGVSIGVDYKGKNPETTPLSNSSEFVLQTIICAGIVLLTANPGPKDN
jgi:hypothetical protein